MMKKIILFIFLSLTLSCQQKDSDVLNKKVYKNILKELILINLAKQELKKDDSLNKNLLELVYRKYKIDSLKLKKTTDYYSKHPEQLSKIYDEIYLEFKKVSDSFEKINPKKPLKTDKIKLPKNILKSKQKKQKQKEFVYK